MRYGNSGLGGSMDSGQGGTLLLFFSLVVSLIGNIAQYFLPIKKSKQDTESVASATAKNIAEAYAMTLKSLRERIEVLELERKLDKEEITRLVLQVKEQEVEIKTLRDTITELLGATQPKKQK